MTPHVVIIGGGFGGLDAARALARARVRITLVDRHNYHLFQPLLYQVATACLSPGDIASPIRWILRRQRNVQVLLAEAHEWAEAHWVTFRRREFSAPQTADLPKVSLHVPAYNEPPDMLIETLDAHGLSLRKVKSTWTVLEVETDGATVTRQEVLCADTDWIVMWERFSVEADRRLLDSRRKRKVA